MKKNKQKFTRNVIICTILFITILLTSKSILSNVRFGLDLQGGFEVLYQVKPITGNLTNDMVTNTYKTIGRRIDVLGVTEPSIIVEGKDRIRVQLAGVTDKDEARNILGKQASLSFRDTSDNLLMASNVLKSGGAKVSQDQTGRPAVALNVSDNDKFYEVTKNISKKSDNRLVIWLDFEDGVDSFKNEQYKCGGNDSNCLSAATVSQGFSGDVIIQGNFTEKEVRTLVELINSGSLPTKLVEISSKTVGAEFGEDSLVKTYTAGIIGVALIMLSMTIIYRFAGFISSLGIVIYTYATFLLFYLIGGVLTLPGIAALVIGIGMAIDTCVINFARIKDELRMGAGLNRAFVEGNKSSFLTIIDANLTTFLVAIILFFFGESSIKGFATMLMVSIFITIIVMLYVTRWLLKIFVNTRFFDNKLKLFIGIKPYKNETTIKSNKIEYSKVDFVKISRVTFPMFAVLIIFGVSSLFINKMNLGLDFKGGTNITLKYNKNITEDNIKQDLNTLKYDLIDMEYFGENSVSIKIKNVLNGDQVNSTEKYFNDKYEANTDIGVISNIVKKDMINNAILSVIYASIGIIIYVSLRFKFSFAVGGIIALFHDVFFMIALFSFFKLEVTSIFIAALLSIIGYSINDTIVTYDRIRENLKTLKKDKITNKDLADAANLSLRQTVTRSIITTVMTLFPVLTLIIFGSHEIINFNIALLFGLISGVYSSIFIATQIWLFMTIRELKKPVKVKKVYKEVEELKVKGVNY